MFESQQLSAVRTPGRQKKKKIKEGIRKNKNLGTDSHAIHHENRGGWLWLINRDSLDDLEESSVELGENLVAVFKLKANVVGFHPCDVLGGKKEKEATRYIWKYSCSTAVFSCQVVKTLIGFKVDMVTKFSSYERAAAQWSVHASTCWMLLPPLIQLYLSSTKSQQRSSQNALNCITEIKPNNQRAPFEQALGSGKGKKNPERTRLKEEQQSAVTGLPSFLVSTNLWSPLTVQRSNKCLPLSSLPIFWLGWAGGWC